MPRGNITTGIKVVIERLSVVLGAEFFKEKKKTDFAIQYKLLLL